MFVSPWVGEINIAKSVHHVNTPSITIALPHKILAIRHWLGYIQPMPNVNPKIQTSAFTMRVDEEFFHSLDEARRKEADLPSRSELVRRLVMRAAKKGGK